MPLDEEMEREFKHVHREMESINAQLKSISATIAANHSALQVQVQTNSREVVALQEWRESHEEFARREVGRNDEAFEGVRRERERLEDETKKSEQRLDARIGGLDKKWSERIVAAEKKLVHHGVVIAIITAASLIIGGAVVNHHMFPVTHAVAP